MKISRVLNIFSSTVMMSMLLLTNACGLKGDLYIPAKEASSASTNVDSGEEHESASESRDEESSD